MNRRFPRISSKAIWSKNKERLMFDSEGLTQKSLEYKEHISRYTFASRFVKNKIILDVACGTGYGSSYLEHYEPKIVVGVDISKEAIAKGKALFQKELLELLIGDATNMALKNGSFDVVVSFETIEHLQAFERFLAEVKRILKNDGIFVISTPNKEAFSGYDQFYLNEFHTKEFTMPEFFSLLHRYFDRVDPYGEVQIGVMYKTLRNLRRIVIMETGVDPLGHCKLVDWLLGRFSKSESVYALSRIEKQMPKYLIAVCYSTS
jgi:SAM-dependent methyltransferase